MEELCSVWMLSRRRDWNKREVVGGAEEVATGRSKMNSWARKLRITQIESKGASQENRVKTYMTPIMSNN